MVGSGPEIEVSVKTWYVINPSITVELLPLTKSNNPVLSSRIKAASCLFSSLYFILPQFLSAPFVMLRNSP